MIRLFVPYFTTSNPERQAEIDRCLKLNVECKAIDQVVVVTEGKLPTVPGIIGWPIHERPTFDLMFYIMNELAGGEDISILSNADIFFDETIGLAKQLRPGQVFALTRWDNDNAAKEYRHIERVDSQDSWVFRGKVAPIKADFYMGICGCDNTLAYRLHNAGYDVRNPSLTIKSYHLHNSGVRTYNTENKTPQPYKTVQFTK